MSFLDSLFGGKPPKYHELQSLLQLIDAQRAGTKIGNNLGTTATEGGNLLNFLSDRMAGKDILTDAQWAHLLAPVMAQIASSSQAQQFQAGQTAAAMNLSPRSGALARMMDDAGRTRLNAERQARGEAIGQRASVLNSNAMAGASQLQQLLEGDQSFRGGEHTKAYNAAAARATSASGLGKFLMMANKAAADYFGGQAMSSAAGGAAPVLNNTPLASFGAPGQPLLASAGSTPQGFGGVFPNYSSFSTGATQTPGTSNGLDSAFARAFGTGGAASLYAR